VRACRLGLALTAVRVSRQPGTTNEMGAYVAKAKPSTGASQTDSAIEQRWAAGCERGATTKLRSASNGG
jgi:hypothetical protein